MAPRSATSASETTPLLATVDFSATPAVGATPPPPAATTTTNPAAHDDEEEDPDRPLPVFQVFILSIARFCEPLAYFSIFAFVQQQIHDQLGVPSDQVGFYTGLVESMFSLVQVFLMIPWGLAADKFGRKPCLVLSLSGVGIAQILFGLSTTMTQLILFRCIAGFFAGTVVTVRAMFSEVSTKKTQARAFSYFAFAGNLGIFLGPALGGFLSRPAQQWPRLFGNVKLLIEFPYLLPCLITGSTCFVASLLCFFFLNETLKPDQVARAKASGGTSMRELAKAPGVAKVMGIFALNQLIGLGYTAVLPVFYFTPVKLGGYGWEPQTISLFMALGGMSQALWLLVAFPWLEQPHRLRISGVMKWTAAGWLIVFLLLPALNWSLRLGWTSVFWTVASVSNVMISSVGMGYTAMQLALNNVSPSPAVLGVLNGIALSASSAIRTVAPGLFASTFASGVSNQILGGHLVFVVLWALAALLAVSLKWLPEGADTKIAVESKRDDGLGEEQL